MFGGDCMNIIDDIEMYDKINIQHKIQETKKEALRLAEKLHEDMSKATKTIGKQLRIQEIYRCADWCEDCKREMLRTLN